MNYNYLQSDGSEYRSWKELLALFAAGLAIGMILAVWLGSHLFLNGRPVPIPTTINTSKE